jgi:sugar lactone lactonase YvrE
MPAGAEEDVTMVESVFAVAATLGEGPVWIGDALWFVDIKAHRLYRFDPASKTAQHWTAPDQIGWVLPSERGDLIAGVKTGLHRFDPATGTFTLFHDPEPQHPDNRLNDATTDSRGRIWFGTMDDNEAATTGRLHRLANGQTADSGLPAVAITNGPAVSADATMLYHTDTLGKRIWRVPIHDDGTLGTPVLHVEIEDGAGYPDGCVIDSENCLWTGLWGGWRVRRYDPAGVAIAEVRFPVSNITKIAFGGADLRTAYATTASKGLDPAARAVQPEAGNLFAFDPGVAGLPVTPAKL